MWWWAPWLFSQLNPRLNSSRRFSTTSSIWHWPFSGTWPRPKISKAELWESERGDTRSLCWSSSPDSPPEEACSFYSFSPMVPGVLGWRRVLKTELDRGSQQASGSAGDHGRTRTRRTRLQHSRAKRAPAYPRGGIRALLQHRVLQAKWSLCRQMGWSKEDSCWRVIPPSWTVICYSLG